MSPVFGMAVDSQIISRLFAIWSDRLTCFLDQNLYYIYVLFVKGGGISDGIMGLGPMSEPIYPYK